MKKKDKEVKVTKTKILNCVCNNDYQDQKYGYGKRVMNSYVKGYRCTSCNKEHSQ